MAGSFRITFGLTVVLLGVAVARSSALTSAPLVLLGGLAFITAGTAVGTDGFTGVRNLVAWAAFILFGVIATIAASRSRIGDHASGHQSTQNRLTHH